MICTLCAFEEGEGEVVRVRWLWVEWSDGTGIHLR